MAEHPRVITERRSKCPNRQTTAETAISSLRESGLERIRKARRRRNWKQSAWTCWGGRDRWRTRRKEFGKIPPDERARLGKALNAAKQELESAFETRKAAFDASALNARLEAEWLDLTLPAPGPRRGSAPSRHHYSERDRRPVRVHGIHRARRPRGGDRVPQLRCAEHSARASRARHAGHLLARRRQSAAHAHVSRAGARHAETRSAAANDCSRPRLPQRRSGRIARAHLLPVGRHDGGSRCVGCAPDLLHADPAEFHLQAAT